MSCKLVVLSFLLAGGIWLVHAGESLQALDDPELDPMDVEEPGCPKIHNLTPILNYKEVSIGEFGVKGRNPSHGTAIGFTIFWA